MKDKLIEMEEYAKNNNIPIMENEGIQFLSSYIQENNVESILELGSAIGYSAIQMARVSNSVKIVTVERDRERYKEAKKNIKACDLENQIEIYLDDALVFETTKTYDLIFIDAAKAQYTKFFERYQINLNEKGAIISDNLKFHGFVETKERIQNRNTRQLVNKIKNYILYLEENEEFETIFKDVGDGIAISQRRNVK